MFGFSPAVCYDPLVAAATRMDAAATLPATRRFREVVESMRAMLGCAGMIAAVAFIFGVIGSLFATQATLAERLMIAATPAVIAFFAALLLCSRDYARHTETMRMLRAMLLARHDISDADYLAHFSGVDSVLLLQTRQAVSRFFDVPAEKIHPTDTLRDDLQFETLEPSFHSFVAYHVFAARNILPQPFSFRTSDLADLGDLAREIQRVLDGFETGKTDHDRSQ